MHSLSTIRALNDRCAKAELRVRALRALALAQLLPHRADLYYRLMNLALRCSALAERIP